MHVQYTAGPERKQLVTACAATLITKSTYAGMPSAAYIVGEYTITREGALTGPDNRDLAEALRQQGF